ncbi:MAG: lipocalin-like domain-containing protein [Rhodoferax sp.]
MPHPRQPVAPALPRLALPRRTVLMAALGLGAGSAWSDAAQAPALQPRPLRFPADFGSHPDTAIEWWYLTGDLQGAGQRWGFQVTFFRSRVPQAQALRSNLAARQLIFAHVAITDVASGRLHHDQRVARSAGASVADRAWARPDDTDVRIDHWTLRRQADGRYQTHIDTPELALELTLQPTQPLLLQGEAGWSRKGPQPTQASFYYSQPQLRVGGALRLGARKVPIQGRGWLDHEWSQSLLDPQAVGWDWLGMNLDDGAALTAFQLRTAQGQALWAGGSWRAHADAPVQALGAQQVRMKPLAHWTSAATGTRYPVAWALEIALDGAAQAPRSYRVQAVTNAQELDSRNSTGAIYWEGLSTLSTPSGQPLGSGYLELTGYASPLRL